jgi:hypothetical protein
MDLSWREEYTDSTCHKSSKGQEGLASFWCKPDLTSCEEGRESTPGEEITWQRPMQVKEMVVQASQSLFLQSVG